MSLVGMSHGGGKSSRVRPRTATESAMLPDTVGNKARSVRGRLWRGGESITRGSPGAYVDNAESTQSSALLLRRQIGMLLDRPLQRRLALDVGLFQEMSEELRGTRGKAHQIEHEQGRVVLARTQYRRRLRIESLADQQR